MIAVNDMLGFEVAGEGMFWQKQVRLAYLQSGRGVSVPWSRMGIPTINQGPRAFNTHDISILRSALLEVETNTPTQASTNKRKSQREPTRRCGSGRTATLDPSYQHDQVFTNYTGNGIVYQWEITARPDGALWFTNSATTIFCRIATVLGGHQLQHHRHRRPYASAAGSYGVLVVHLLQQPLYCTDHASNMIFTIYTCISIDRSRPSSPAGLCFALWFTFR